MFTDFTGDLSITGSTGLCVTFKALLRLWGIKAEPVYKTNLSIFPHSLCLVCAVYRTSSSDAAGQVFDGVCPCCIWVENKLLALSYFGLLLWLLTINQELISWTETDWSTSLTKASHWVPQACGRTQRTGLLHRDASVSAWWSWVSIRRLTIRCHPETDEADSKFWHLGFYNRV